MSEKRINELLNCNNHQVEMRRRADRLLRTHLQTFRFYESQHRAKRTPEGEAKAEHNRMLAEQIETYFKEIHNAVG